MDFTFFLSLEQGRLVGSSIILLITALVISAIRQLATQSRRMGLELRAIQALQALFEEVSGVPETSTGLVAALESTGSGDSLVGKRLATYASAIDRRAEVDREALSAIDVETVRMSLAWSRFVGGAVVLLGLAGTLYGLSVAVGGLGIGDNGFSVEAMKDGLSSALSGMKTAFSTTLVGVVGALVVGAVLASVRRRQSATLIELERFTSEFLASRSDSDAHASLKAAADGLWKLTTHWADLRERVATELQRIFDTISTSMRSLLENFEETQQMAAALIGDVDDDQSSLAEHARTLDNASTAILAAAQETRELLPELERTLLSAAEHQSNELREVIEQYYGSMTRQIESQTESTRELTAGVRATAASVEAISSNLGSFAEAASQYSDIWQTVTHSVQSATMDIGERLSVVQRAVEDTLSRVSQGNTASQERVIDALRDYERSLRDTLQSLEAERSRVAQRSNELLDGLRESLRDAIRELGSRGDTLQESTVTAIRQSFRELEREIRNLVRAAETRNERKGRSSRVQRTSDSVRLDDLGQRLRSEFPPKQERTGGERAGEDPTALGRQAEETK